MARRARKGDPKLVVAYVRVSTEDQNLGPEAQRAAVERWCASSGARVVAWHEDHGVSGAAPLEKRPGLLAALDALAEHGAGLLLVAKRDRLARDVVAAGMIERLVERAGAKVVSGAGEGNGDGPEAMLMRGIVDLFASYERQLIKARTKAALAVKRRKGERVGEVPFGQRLAADGVHLEPVEAEQVTITTARQLRAEGRSLRAVGEGLASRGMLPRSGRRWHVEQVRRLLLEAA